MRTSQQIQDEIALRFGFFPPFYLPALDSPLVLENLWQQTVSAYLDNPLSPLFKEKLNALLSRYCAVPYCIVCHASALRPLGLTAGEVLALLDSPLPALGAGAALLDGLPIPDPKEAASPRPGSPLEQALLSCAGLVFLERDDAAPCRAALRRLLGPGLYPHLVSYLAYIKTCHLWMESHPEISYEADRRVQENLGPLLAAEPALADFFAQYQERMGQRRMEHAVAQARGEERLQADFLLRESEDKYRLLVEGARDYAMILLDASGCISHWNSGARRILGYDESDMLGQPIRVIFTPEDQAAGAAEGERAKAAAEGRAMDVRWHQRRDGSRFWADGVLECLRGEGGNIKGYVKVLRDATDRRQAEEALRQSEARFRQMADAIPHMAWTAEADGTMDYYNQRWYDYFDHTFGRERGWVSVIHPDDQEAAGAAWNAAFAAGTVSELEYRLRRRDGVYRWHLGRSEPVRDEAGKILKWVGTATDIEERRQAEDERERLLADAEARAERERLRNRIGEAIRESDDPDEIQQRAAAVLAEALGVDRCYFATYDAARNVGSIRREWHRLDLPPMPGQFFLSDFPQVLDALQSGRSLIVTDTRTDSRLAALAPALERLGLRAAVRVPLFGAGQITGIVGVGMAEAARIWTADEVALVETVAAQTRSAVHAARLRLREHTIATQLQEALQPSLPESFPGLQLRKYYEAALAEAGVGGDFYDAFPLDTGCTALVVGDLSGKGLAAAAQVSTVRNMLRATLYLGRTLAEAVTNLNDILADNDLLTGFATLFVGAHDSATGTLTYVNCGQEPGLLRRAATGVVEELLPTGPVLGTFAGAVFTENSVMLTPGDALALFTDGLTEAGPTRAGMLGIEGVAALMESQSFEGRATGAGQCAEDLCLCLIAGVDRFAPNGAHDDVCLLIAVAEG